MVAVVAVVVVVVVVVVAVVGRPLCVHSPAGRRGSPSHTPPGGCKCNYVILLCNLFILKRFYAYLFNSIYDCYT